MKKIIYLLFLIVFLSSSALVSADVYNTTKGLTYTGMAYLKASFVNQNPSSANPGEYADLLFNIENRGTNNAENVTVQLIPEYPFSLDPGVSAVQNLGTINGFQVGNDAFLVRYRVKVDKNAVEGYNEIKLKYYSGDGSQYNLDEFNISVANSRTDFDVVAQDSTTLAIANIGDNTAQSVIVRIPQQQNFRVSGASGNIIGNLNAGDYTLTTFQITSAANISARGNFTRSNESINSVNNNLIVEISYTDTLGIRRTVDKNVSFGFSLNTTGITGQAFQRTQSLTLSTGLLYIIIGVVGIVVIVVIVKIKTRKKK